MQRPPAPMLRPPGRPRGGTALDDTTIKVLVVEPMKPCRVQEISDTLEAIQRVVGGKIEAVFPFNESVAVVLNRDGKTHGLPFNRPLLDSSGQPCDILCGTFFIAGVQGEHFASLTDEQISRYKELYDNMMVLTAERPAAQAEIAPEAVMSYFAIGCQISFRITNEDQQADTLQAAFESHVREVFRTDDALSESLCGDLHFSFDGRHADVEYNFADLTTEEAIAESFSEQCVRNAQDRLEGFGCKIERIDCVAERLEDDPPSVKEQPRKQETQKKKGNHYER